MPAGGRDAPPLNRNFGEHCTIPIHFCKAQVASRYSLQSQTLVLRPTHLRCMQRHMLCSPLLPPCQGGLHDVMGDGSASTGRVRRPVRDVAAPIRYIPKAGRGLASIISPAPLATPLSVKPSQPSNLPAGVARAKQEAAPPSAESSSARSYRHMASNISVAIALGRQHPPRPPAGCERWSLISSDRSSPPALHLQ